MENANLPQPLEAMPKELQERLRDYYAKFYRDMLGLPDWERRVETRRNEEQNILVRFGLVEPWIGGFKEGMKTLVVGGGTGAEFIAFSRRQCETYAVEPNTEAASIAQERARRLGIPPDRFLRSPGEALPFLDESFDFVWCYMVIEHVQDVARCVSEMIRVVKPFRHIFICAPDYRQFYEPHYKVSMPMAAPKWLLKIWLRVLGRPPGFLDTLNFVNARKMMNLFKQHPVVAFQAVTPWTEAWKKGRLPFGSRVIKFIVQRLGIQRDQFWLVQKRPDLAGR